MDVRVVTVGHGQLIPSQAIGNDGPAAQFLQFMLASSLTLISGMWGASLRLLFPAKDGAKSIPNCGLVKQHTPVNGICLMIS